MVRSLPILKLSLLLTWTTSSDVSIGAVGSGTASGGPVSNTPAMEDGRHLLKTAAERLDQVSVSARLRQRAQFFGQSLVGSGRYLQRPAANGLQLRWDIQFQLGAQTVSWQEINNGRFLWRREAVDDDVKLSRTDLTRVQGQLTEQGRGGDIDIQRRLVGGLPRFLQFLASQFEFPAPRESQLRGLPVWLLKGDRPQNGSPIENRSVPCSVYIYLARDSLFPHRIEFADAEQQVVFTIELFEVAHGITVDPREFQFQQAEMGFDDQTQAILRELTQGR